MVPLDRAFRWIVPGGALALLATIGLVGWFTQPPELAPGFAPVQPIPFSHALHAGTLEIACLYCHPGAARSRIAGVPGPEVCMGCHAVTLADRPAIQALKHLYDSGETLAWKRVHRLPDHVFFDHRPHVAAGMLCQSCHGEVQTMDVLARRMPLRMSHCLACHRDPGKVLPPGTVPATAAEHCSACHR